jgi:hypothetical protein
MIESILASIYTSIAGKLAEAFAWAFSPLWRWYAIGGAIILACIVLAWLSRLLFDIEPMKWLRFGLGLVVLLVGAYLAGGTQMYREQQARMKAERERQRQAAAQRRPW